MPQITPPSLPVRIIATWLVIFPLVALGQIAMTPLAQGWHPMLRAAVLTAVVVPLAVGLAVPRLIKVLTMLQRRVRDR
jgi:antibiotic biosynthesis monooxygenase (ABM) superfamily enzyme